MERTADFESHLVLSLGAIRTIKSLGLESYAQKKTERRFKELLKVAFRSSSNSLVSNAALIVITQLFTIGILWIGSHYTINKELTPGELISFFAIITYITTPISSLITSNKQVHNAFVAADRLFELMDLKSDHTTINSVQKLEEAGDILSEDATVLMRVIENASPEVEDVPELGKAKAAKS